MTPLILMPESLLLHPTDLEQGLALIAGRGADDVEGGAGAPSIMPRWRMTLRTPRTLRATDSSSERPRNPASVVTAGLPRRMAVLPRYFEFLRSLPRVSSMMMCGRPKARANSRGFPSKG